MENYSNIRSLLWRNWERISYLYSIHLYSRQPFSPCTRYIWYIYYTRLLGRFALIFYFNCEHVLFVYIVKQNKKICGFQQKISWIFKKFWRSNFDGGNFFILLIHKPSLGSREGPHKVWAWSVEPFWRLLDTNKQTDTQTS